MYPRLSDIFQDLFGFSLPFPIYSFGAMLAVAFLVAAWLARKRLDEMYADGEISSVRVELPDDKGRKRKQEASPSVLVGTITIIAVAAGLVGAKLFHILENLGPFMEDPTGMIFSTGGLTFYGGLICAGLAIVWYARKKGLSVGAMADAIGPTVLLAYGIGRIGCYLAGDGDWGVCSDLADKPGWIPAWLWSEEFSNSILGAPATVLENCPPGADGVYPTMLYEFAMAAILFGILWSVRKHPFKRGWLFMLFLTFAGIERLLIEQIRVNNEFDLFGMVVTQAEVISVSIIAAGLIGLAFFTRRRDPERQPDEATASA
jgi:phosphatidylglycerol:prolipoprotein diacylglycerol transferase